jgi:hypothetical protein
MQHAIIALQIVKSTAPITREEEEILLQGGPRTWCSLQPNPIISNRDKVRAGACLILPPRPIYSLPGPEVALVTPVKTTLVPSSSVPTVAVKVS